jgi:glycosyltransferase involved in cell wall biosynthesis
MKISILVPDLSCKYGNCMSRAYLFAKILQRQYDVEIVGLSMESTIWKPVAQDSTMVFKLVEVGITSKKQILNLIPRMNDLVKQIDGDIIYASKPLLMTLGVGLYANLLKSKPIIVDLDDWQMGIRAEKLKSMPKDQKRKELFNSAFEVYKTSSYWNNYFGEKLIKFADAITVSSNFLKEKFDGEVIRHAVDTDLFNPENFDPNAIKAQLGIEADQKVLIFCGSLQIHKGIEDLIEAVSLIPEEMKVLLVVIGNDDGWGTQQLIKAAKEKLGDKFRCFGVQPFEKIPEFIAIADMVVIPQRKTLATIGQIPIKMFEGMAMAKPVVSTRVSDIPDILENCGTVVDPQNPVQLAAAIQDILEHPEVAKQKGKEGRIQCLENYSWDAVEKLLTNLIQKVGRSA